MPLTQRAALTKDRTNAKADVLQHRHFAVIAGIIRDLPRAQRGDVAERFANKLRETNSRFDFNRFIAACLKE